MKMKKERFPALLLLGTVCGLALASWLYLTDMIQIAFDRGTKFDLTGTLFPLFLAFMGGIFVKPLHYCAMLVFIRSFSLVLSCYIRFVTPITISTLTVFIISCLELFWFVAFCRLAILYGRCNQRKRYLRQFWGDYLFFCGISSVFRILRQLIKL